MIIWASLSMACDVQGPRSSRATLSDSARTNVIYSWDTPGISVTADHTTGYERLHMQTHLPGYLMTSYEMKALTSTPRVSKEKPLERILKPKLL